ELDYFLHPCRMAHHRTDCSHLKERPTVVSAKFRSDIVTHTSHTPVPVDEPGLIGLYARPTSPGPHPGVIAVTGSSGGFGPTGLWAQALADHGFATLAVAYFGLPNLPSELRQIEVEVVGRAAQWLDTRPEVSAAPLAIMGVSRGSELALLAGLHV